MSRPIDRRRLLQTAALAAGPGGAARAAQETPRLVAGVMGTGGRGTSLAGSFQKLAGVEVAYVCDADRTRAERAAGEVVKAGAAVAPQAVTDFRRILDDRRVDILVIAACNHWHAPATILACAAGKHVYVEKPCSHNPREGELMVEAARRSGKRVQMGNQRRSWPGIRQGIEAVRGGAIGRVYFAQCWYFNDRPSIGKGRATPIPAGLDYDLWQGPAPRRPFRDNYLHYNWHWFWHWGNGELGNNGVHYVDLCRWGLEVDYPTLVTSAGGRFRYDDDQETPDTQVTTYVFEGGKSILWEGLSCSRIPGPRPCEILFHGENGTLGLVDRGYVIWDRAGKEVKRHQAEGGDAIHLQNFVDAVRGEATLTSEIEEGHRSTLLCHLGNIAQRAGRTLRCDPKNGRILGESVLMREYWSREYEKGWEPRVQA